MVVPAIKAWDRLDRWRGEWETHIALARDAAASRELLATAAPLAAADQLTPIAMGNLLGIAVGDDLTATACAARRVLVALHQDPDAVDLATPLEPQDMERIWAATEKLRVASPTPAPSWLT
jgi:hypothetical protein